jgi:hypothetical protein
MGFPFYYFICSRRGVGTTQSRGGIFTIFTISLIKNSNMDVNFYAEFNYVGYDESPQEHLQQLKDFQKLEEPFVNILSQKFELSYGFSVELTEEKLLEVLQELDPFPFLKLELSFAWKSLEQTLLKVQMIDLVLQNVALRSYGFEYHCEYHLDE